MTTRIIGCLLFISTCAVAQLEGRKSESGKFGFTNETGEWVIQPMYSQIFEFSESQFTLVKLKDKWGVIDQQGKTILPFEFSKMENLDYGDDQLFSVMKDKRYGLLDLHSAKMRTECIYENDFHFYDGIIQQLGVLAIVYKNNKVGLINEQGTEVVPCIYDKGKNPFEELENNFFRVSKNGKVGAIDTVGREIVPCIYDKINVSGIFEPFEVVSKGKFGYCDFTGKEVIAPLYDKSFFFEGDFAYVRLKGKYGIINRKGETVKPFIYTKESDVFEEFTKLFVN